MDSPLRPLLDRIKAAREQKGLSQRALGERVGLPQSHISKIESGSVDLQASSLLEIARALDLEVILVPRVTLPAIRAMQQEMQRTETPASRAEINRQFQALRKQAGRLVDRFPRVQVFARLIDTANELQSMSLAATDETLHELSRFLKTTLGQLAQINRAIGANRDTTRLIHDIEITGVRMTRLRNGIAHGPPPSARQRPAYRLDDEEASDG
jgi:transcriptional regulator with XRE-family HTH domain